MIDQLQQRAEGIRQVLHEHPERGADLLMDFARRFATDARLEDEVILLKIELTEAITSTEKVIVTSRLEQIASQIVANYDPIAAKYFIEKERALVQNIRMQVPADDVVMEAKNIAKRYPGSKFTLRLDHLELRLGQITGLVGENATGKTTLLRILAGDLTSDTGTLRFPLFDPQGCRSWPHIKQKIAYVPQEFPVWHGSLKDNLRYEAALHGVRDEENSKAVNYIVQRLGLGLYLDRKWAELSGGYKLRFALAKALIWQAQLLILDEPLAFLDVKTQLVVLNDLQNLAKGLRHPMAVLISSQHLHETESVADQMLFMSEGKVENLGSTIEIGAKRTQNVFEIGCAAGYGELTQHLEEFSYYKIWYNGLHWFVATPLSVSGFDLQQHLNEQGIMVDYYRDLSRSVKIKFYADNL